MREVASDAFKRGFKAGADGGKVSGAEEERRRCARIASRVGLKAMKQRESLPDRVVPPIAYLPLDGQSAALEIETLIRG